MQDQREKLCPKCETYRLEPGKALCHSCLMSFMNTPFQLARRFPGVDMENFPKRTPSMNDPVEPGEPAYCFCAPCSCKRLQDPGGITTAEGWITNFPAGKEHQDGQVLDSYNRKFGWAIPNRATIQRIKTYSPILEVASGMGYWAHELRGSGADIIATDPSLMSPSKRWTEVQRFTGLEAIRAYPDHNLLICWPEMAEWPTDIVEAFSGEHLLYVGEERGGCTGRSSMFDVLEDRYTLLEEQPVPTFSLHNDRLFVYRRD